MLLYAMRNRRFGATGLGLLENSSTLSSISRYRSLLIVCVASTLTSKLTSVYCCRLGKSGRFEPTALDQLDQVCGFEPTVLDQLWI